MKKRKYIVLDEETYHKLAIAKIGDESFNSLISRMLENIRYPFISYGNKSEDIKS